MGMVSKVEVVDGILIFQFPYIDDDIYAFHILCAPSV